MHELRQLWVMHLHSPLRMRDRRLDGACLYEPPKDAKNGEVASAAPDPRLRERYVSLDLTQAIVDDNEAPIAEVDVKGMRRRAALASRRAESTYAPDRSDERRTAAISKKRGLVMTRALSVLLKPSPSQALVSLAARSAAWHSHARGAEGTRRRQDGGACG